MIDVRENMHIWQRCDNCRCQPIIGNRYECQTCSIGPHIDLCSSCFELYEQGQIEHPGRENFSRVSGVHHFRHLKTKLSADAYNWLKIPFVNRPKPSVLNGFLVRPEFHANKFQTNGPQNGSSIQGSNIKRSYINKYSCIGGYGFIVESSNGLIMLTALHVLDEMIKKKNIDASVNNLTYTGHELAEIISEVTLYDVLKTKWMFHTIGVCSSMIPLQDARTGEEEPNSDRDIAAFLVEHNLDLQPHQLAVSPPVVGETIWLAVKMSHYSNLLPAVVVECSKKSLIFRFDSIDGPEPRYTSGAPLINYKGEVVGINIGAGSFENCRLGHANHVGNIRRHLQLENQL